MVVVADTAPINYVVLIEQIDLLTRAARILIPPEVLADLKHPLATETGSRLGLRCAQVLEVLSPKDCLPRTA